jgi:hypothetical protein
MGFMAGLNWGHVAGGWVKALFVPGLKGCRGEDVCSKVRHHEGAVFSRRTGGRIGADQREEHLSWINPECMMILMGVKSLSDLQMCISTKY